MLKMMIFLTHSNTVFLYNANVLKANNSAFVNAEMISLFLFLLLLPLF